MPVSTVMSSLLCYFRKQSEAERSQTSQSPGHGESSSPSTSPSDPNAESSPGSGSDSPSDPNGESSPGSGSDSETESEGESEERPPKVARPTTYSDIADYVGKRLSSEELYALLKEDNLKTVPDGYVFPKNKKGRSFQKRWLELYKWLAYSESEDGGYCLFCVLFGRDFSSYHGCKQGCLARGPLTSFGKALEVLKKHTTKEHHKSAALRAHDFLRVMDRKQPSARSLISRALSERIAQNRLVVASLIKTVVLCGRQCFALRGHRDSGVCLEESVEANPGNFLALLQFRMEAGDKVLATHVSKAAKNGRYTSPQVQNEIIDVVGSQITKSIVSKVNAGKFFTVIADEVTDLSNKEILTLVIRYVELESTTIREDFVSYVECDTGVTGKCLADKIISSLTTLGLNLNYLRGQAYDGAGNMAGAAKGAAALITKRHCLALYLHCSSHCLNLAVVKSLQIASIRNMMGVINRTYVFFDSHPKRQKSLEKAISEFAPASKILKLKDLCRTRWVQRIDALNVFRSLLLPVVACFQSIFSEGPSLWSSDSVTDAKSLELALCNSEFLCSMILTNNCLNYLQGLTSGLQAEGKDLLCAVKEIDTVIATLQEVRTNCSKYHQIWFEKVVSLSEAIGNGAVQMPRRCEKQRHRDNVPATSAEKYYLRSITIPLLDHLISELKSRFTPHHKAALQAFVLVPSVLVTLTEEEARSSVQSLVAMYENDLPSPETIESEFDCWRTKWKTANKEEELPTSPIAALEHTSLIFQNIAVLLRIVCVLPVTSCSAERSFSALKRLKSPLRTTMATNRLTALSLLQIHRDIPIDVEKAVDDFARKHPRRLELNSILDN